MTSYLKQTGCTLVLLIGVVMSHPSSTDNSAVADYQQRYSNVTAKSGLKAHVDPSTGKIITNPEPTLRFDARLNTSRPQSMAPLVMKSKQPQGGTIVYFGKQLHAGLHARQDHGHTTAECLINHVHPPQIRTPDIHTSVQPPPEGPAL